MNSKKKEQPDREWRDGFVAWNCWNSAYQMAIDTKGIINGTPGCLAYWDFKGGSHFIVKYKNFEYLLLTILELIKRKLYFPSYNDEKFEDFNCGRTRELIDFFITKINGKEKWYAKSRKK